MCMLSSLPDVAAWGVTGTHSENRSLAARRLQNVSAPQAFQTTALRESAPEPVTVMRCLNQLLSWSNPIRYDMAYLCVRQ